MIVGKIQRMELVDCDGFCADVGMTYRWHPEWWGVESRTSYVPLDDGSKEYSYQMDFYSAKI